MTATGVVLLIWYYIVWWQAERPKAGTLEWIDRWERPRFALSSCGKALHRADALWALLPAVLAAVAALLLQTREPLYGGILGVLLRFEIGDLTLYLSGETICAALAAAAAYLLGKALTGRMLAGLAGALLYAVQPTEELFSCLLLGGTLLLWLWAAYPRRGIWNWMLLLFGTLLAGAAAAAFPFFFYALAPALLITLAVVLIHRVRQDVCGGWYALLVGAAGLLAAVVGFAVTVSLFGEVALFSPEFFLLLGEFFRDDWEVFSAWLLYAPIDMRLPAVLALSGLVPLVLLWHDRRDGGALFLLFWALPFTLHCLLAPALLLLPFAALVCAYLTGRLFDRGRPVVAGLSALGAIAVLGLQDVLWEFLNATFYF